MTIWTDLPVHNWGATAAECERPQPCDRFLSNPDDTLFRAIDIAAPPAIAFHWLCQLRAAPYSYDWIDNLGRQSPLTLTPGLEQLAIGQRVMGIFRLVDFKPDRHLTILLDSSRAALFLGQVAITYAVSPARRQSRLLVKLLVRYPRGLLGMAMRCTLPASDLIMMRKQLLNLKHLAETTPLI
jgi:hypothetical protein